MAMFDDKRKSPETLIGPSVKVEGTVVGAGDVIVEGQLIGTLKTDKSVLIGEGAVLKADVFAGDVTIAGQIHGNVHAKGRLVLLASARVYGNVESAGLSVADGAVLSGKVAMAQAGSKSEAFETVSKRSSKESAM